MTPSSRVVDFSIITPSFKQIEWLELCAASIADQAGVKQEHIVQDGGSGTAIDEWSSRHPAVQVISEPDEGMYDAVNKGLRRAQGDLCAYLNCDEQYLPGALAGVAAAFAAQPELDVLFADAVVVNERGEYVCQRQTLVPNAWHTATCHLNTLTCATFFRRSIVERGLLFDTAWKDLGDSNWVLTLLKNNVRMAHLPVFTTAFTDTGDNMNMRPNARREARLVRERAGVAARMLRPLTVIHHRVRRLMAGCYFPRKFAYQIYTRSSPEQRVEFRVQNPTFVWPTRMRVFE